MAPAAVAPMALERFSARLAQGARVAEVECGSGACTIALALRFPASLFQGFDPDPRAIGLARRRARAAGVARRVRFTIGGACDFAGTGYHLVARLTIERRDPTELLLAARHVRRTLAPDGCWVLLEPGDLDREPVERQSRLRQVLFEGGFTRVSCAPATPSGLLIEARP